MLTVSCREARMDCDYVFKGETKEEIMKTAEEHAMRDHGYKPEDLMTRVKRENKISYYEILILLSFYFLRNLKYFLAYAISRQYSFELQNGVNMSYISPPDL
jgi:predicted small metal-binding protein